MDAVISGRAGIGILLQPQSQYICRSGEITAIPATSVPLLIRGYPDLTLLEDVDTDQVYETLIREIARDDSLHLLLILLDSGKHAPIRREAASALKDLLDLPSVSRHSESILSARPLPSDGDIDGALQICREVGAKEAEDLLSDLRQHQPCIRNVCTAWDAVPYDMFSSPAGRSEFEQSLILEGCYLDLVRAIESSHVGDFLIDALLNPRLAQFRGKREVLLRWTEPFRGAEMPSLKTLITDADWEGFSRQKEEKQRYASRKQVQTTVARVNLQKEAIKEALRERDISRLRRYVADLRADQIKHGGSGFFVKSLCDIAMEAKRFGYYDLQLELTTQAVELEPEDPWAWCQHGDALLLKGDLRNARDAFKLAEVLGDGTIGRIGQAEVAKFDGRYLDALRAYDAIIADLPNDVAARSGRAALLRTLNRLDEALAAYDGIVATHDENVIVLSGRAEVLKDLNRLDEALTTYNRILEIYPDAVVASNGRATVLKKLYRFEESLAAYDSIIAAHPEDFVAKCGRADVLKHLDRLDEALAAYETIIDTHPEEVVPKNGRAGVLKSLDRLNEALTAYNAVIGDYPRDQYAKSGRESTLVLLERYDEALANTAELNPVTSSEWVRYHIRGIALMLLERFDEAIEIFEYGARANPKPASQAYFRTALAVARIRLQKYNQAVEVLQIVDTPNLQIPTAILRIHAYGEMGLRVEANAAYATIRSLPRQYHANQIVAELHDRYLNGKASKHSNEWLMRQEARMLLVA